MSTEKLKQFYILLPLEVERFIEQKGLMDRVAEDIIKCKVMSKYKILERVDPKDRKDLFNIHPEVNGYISQMKDILPPIKRFALVNATKGRLWLFNACHEYVLFRARMQRSFKKRF